MKRKTRSLKLKSASAIKFTRADVREFASQVVDWTEAYWRSARQTPLYVVASKVDPKTQARLERVIAKLFRANGVRRVSFAAALPSDGYAVALSDLRIDRGSCTHCAAAYRVLRTGLTYFSRGVDVTAKIEAVLRKHAKIAASIPVCPSCRNPDQLGEKASVKGRGPPGFDEKAGLHDDLLMQEIDAL